MYGKWKLAFRKSLYSGGKLERGELLLLRASVHIGAWWNKGGFWVAHLLLTLGKAKCEHHCYSHSQCARPLPCCQVRIGIKSRILMSGRTIRHFLFALLGCHSSCLDQCQSPCMDLSCPLGTSRIYKRRVQINLLKYKTLQSIVYNVVQV